MHFPTVFLDSDGSEDDTIDMENMYDLRNRGGGGVSEDHESSGEDVFGEDSDVSE